MKKNKNQKSKDNLWQRLFGTFSILIFTVFVLIILNGFSVVSSIGILSSLFISLFSALVLKGYFDYTNKKLDFRNLAVEGFTVLIVSFDFLLLIGESPFTDFGLLMLSFALLIYWMMET